MAPPNPTHLSLNQPLNQPHSPTSGMHFGEAVVPRLGSTEVWMVKRWAWILLMAEILHPPKTHTFSEFADICSVLLIFRWGLANTYIFLIYRYILYPLSSQGFGNTTYRLEVLVMTRLFFWRISHPKHLTLHHIIPVEPREKPGVPYFP